MYMRNVINVDFFIDEIMKILEAYSIINSAPYIFTDEEIESFEFKVRNKVPNKGLTLAEVYLLKWKLLPQKELIYSKIRLARIIFKIFNEFPSKHLLISAIPSKVYDDIVGGKYWELPYEVQEKISEALGGKYRAYNCGVYIEEMCKYDKNHQHTHYANIFKNLPLDQKFKTITPSNLYERLLKIETYILQKDMAYMLEIYELNIPTYINIDSFYYANDVNKYHNLCLKAILSDEQYSAYLEYKLY